MYIFGINEQFSTKKNTINMKIFNLQGRYAGSRPKLKKTKYTEGAITDCQIAEAQHSNFL
jgi:hypothetical protein